MNLSICCHKVCLSVYLSVTLVCHDLKLMKISKLTLHTIRSRDVYSFWRPNCPARTWGFTPTECIKDRHPPLMATESREFDLPNASCIWKAKHLVRINTVKILATSMLSWSEKTIVAESKNWKVTKCWCSKWLIGWNPDRRSSLLLNHHFDLLINVVS